jgi:hypothetical protein
MAIFLGRALVCHLASAFPRHSTAPSGLLSCRVLSPCLRVLFEGTSVNTRPDRGLSPTSGSVHRRLVVVGPFPRVNWSGAPSASLRFSRTLPRRCSALVLSFRRAPGSSMELLMSVLIRCFSCGIHFLCLDLSGFLSTPLAVVIPFRVGLAPLSRLLPCSPLRSYRPFAHPSVRR